MSTQTATAYGDRLHRYDIGTTTYLSWSWYLACFHTGES